MKSYEIQQLFQRHAKVKALASKMQALSTGSPLYLEGLQGSAAPACFSALPQLLESHRTVLVILNGEDEAGYFYSDLVALCGENDVLFYPSPYKRGVKYAQIDPSNEILRTDVLSRLSSIGEEVPNRTLFIITYPEALAVKVVTQDKLRDSSFSVEVGREYDFSGIEKTLFDLGFRHTDYVYEPGEFAIRGSILDVFSYSSEYPYRIDFFGDEVDSIRTFDVQSQLSVDKVSQAVLVPFVAADDNSRVSFFHFLPKQTVLVQRNPQFVSECIGRIYEEGFSAQALIERQETSGGDISDKVELTAARLLLDSVDFVRYTMDYPSVVLGPKPTGSKGATISFSTQPQPLFHKNFDIIADVLADYGKRKYKIYILADSQKQQERLHDIFEETGRDIPFIPVDHTLHSGFADENLKACFFTDHQIFDRFHKYQLRSGHARNAKVALSLKELNQFKPGDYVTHVDHGIGQFMGLVRIEKNGVEQEMMKLLYQNGDIVYVSVHSLSKVSKFKSQEGDAEPRLSRLGTEA